MKKNIVLALLLIILIIGYFLFLNKPSIASIKPIVSPTASLYDEPKYIGDKLKFIDDNKQPINLVQFKDKWLLLYFGYSLCPDVCPIDLALISNVFNKMKNKDKLQAIFVSIDPNRDIGQMQNFAAKFNKNFVGLTLGGNDLTDLTKSIGVYSEIVKKQEELDMDHSHHGHQGHYLIDHTASYILLNPQKELVALFTNPHIEDATVKALDIIIDNL